MMRPLSDDLRERVVAAVLSGESRRSAAKRFGISVSAAVKLLQRHRATGSIAPGKMGGTANGRWSRIEPSSWSGSISTTAEVLARLGGSSSAAT
ncbi:hypothetical protein MPLDJ20_20205 [Mesorhizobium plurifarium]|uniref:Paired domain-containing protein n=1 Tax=Mesorhizobium plurifarium TaxID=69974 RepID=A0A090GKI0_MESPL|nr:hypothetical protein MPLDJ20_20205 [Mesorhizobium plurifarium]